MNTGSRSIKYLVGVVLIVQLLCSAQPDIMASNSRFVGTTPQVGFITVGNTLQSAAERRLGRGLVTTGTHSGGAREWRVPGGCLIVDGDHFGPNWDRTVVDYVLWMDDPSNGPKPRVNLTYLGLKLGSTKQSVLASLGPRYTIQNAYSRTCFEWNRMLPGNFELSVDIGFKNNRVDLLSVYCGEND